MLTRVTPVLFSSKWGYANRERLGTAGLDAFSIAFQDNQEKKFLFYLNGQYLKGAGKVTKFEITMFEIFFKLTVTKKSF